MISNKHLFMLIITIFIASGLTIGLLLKKPSNVKSKILDTDNTTEPYFKGEIENCIQAYYYGELKFSTMDYTQWDPMENGLWHCKNTFKDKTTNTKHSYLVRATFKEPDIIKMYYIKIDDDTIIWLEEQETEYIDNN